MQQRFCPFIDSVPVSTGLMAVGVHFSPPLSQQVMQTQLAGGVVTMEVLI